MAKSRAPRTPRMPRLPQGLPDRETLIRFLRDAGQAEKADIAKAFGLKGLQERARTVGGWLDISSRPGQGTSVILSIPLPSPPPTVPGDAM